MNNSDFLDAKDDGIGVDPTMMPAIESLDDSPSTVKKQIKPGKDLKKPNNVGNIIKKVLFTIVVLLCMGGVSFGVYYYLSLGTKASKNVPVLEDQNVFVGESLSTSIMEYGDFSKVDISKCSLDVLNVNVNEVGEYEYSITCGDVKYTAKVFVKEKVILNIATKLLYVNDASDIKPEDFIETDEEGYAYTFVNEKQDFNDEGLQKVEIKVLDKDNREMVVYGFAYVIAKEPTMYLTCNSDNESKDNAILNTIDRFAIDDEDNDMDLTIRKYSYKYSDDLAYENILFSMQNGETTIDGHQGFALIDNVNKTIEIIRTISHSEIESEIGNSLSTSYRDIGNFYRRSKGYTCSI